MNDVSTSSNNHHHNDANTTILRKDHLIMNYTHKIDRLPIGEQEEVTKTIFNASLALVRIEKPLQCLT